MSQEALDGLSALLLGWVKLAHAAARRRSGFAFVEAADLAELWRDVVHERAPVVVVLAVSVDVAGAAVSIGPAPSQS